MPQIKIPQKNKIIIVDNNAPLMKSLQTANLPVASSCSGEGICGKCRIFVLQHAKNLTKPTVIEIQHQQKLKIQPNERLACQANVLGDVVIQTSYW